jgi:hypothetical protein
MKANSKSVAVATPINALQAMRAQLAQIKPVEAEAQTGLTLVESFAVMLGSAPSTVLHFGDTVKTSFQYHEAVRKGQL